MSLDDAQKRIVAGWIQQGLKLSDIQNRIASDLGERMTYMDVRLLVDDLKLTPRDPEPVKPPEPAVPPAPESAATPGTDANRAVPGRVSVSVDQIARQGSLVSGKVTFSDGNGADWYLDPAGRLGLAPQQAGYRPPAADVQEFQTALDSELRKLGI